MFGNLGGDGSFLNSGLNMAMRAGQQGGGNPLQNIMKMLQGAPGAPMDIMPTGTRGPNNPAATNSPMQNFMSMMQRFGGGGMLGGMFGQRQGDPMPQANPVGPTAPPLPTTLGPGVGGPVAPPPVAPPVRPPAGPHMVPMGPFGKKGMEYGRGPNKFMWGDGSGAAPVLDAFGRPMGGQFMGNVGGRGFYMPSFTQSDS